MSDVIVIVECPYGFNDFSILKQSVKSGARVEVTEAQFTQMKMSDPSVVVAERRLPIDSEAAEALQAIQAEKDAEKEAIRKRYEKGAPPRRKARKAAPRPPTSRGVSPAELVDFPVTKDE